MSEENDKTKGGHPEKDARRDHGEEPTPKGTEYWCWTDDAGHSLPPVLPNWPVVKYTRGYIDIVTPFSSRKWMICTDEDQMGALNDISCYAMPCSAKNALVSGACSTGDEPQISACCTVVGD
jgi:hypothetical protein